MSEYEFVPTWETIEPGTFGVERYSVPGGWVYKFLNGPKNSGQVCFVPRPTKQPLGYT